MVIKPANARLTPHCNDQPIHRSLIAQIPRLSIGTIHPDSPEGCTHLAIISWKMIRQNYRHHHALQLRYPRRFCASLVRWITPTRMSRTSSKATGESRCAASRSRRRRRRSLAEMHRRFPRDEAPDSPLPVAAKTPRCISRNSSHLSSISAPPPVALAP